MDVERAAGFQELKTDSSDKSINLLSVLNGAAADKTDSVKMPPSLPSFDDFLQSLRPESLDKNSCNAFAKTKNQMESVAATSQGESALNRIYEISVLTPEGKVTAAGFEKAYGKTIADKVQALGITEVERHGNDISVALKNPQHYGDSSGSIDISSSVSFTVQSSGGKIIADNISGVTASSGFFTVDVSNADLQPRAKGYLSGVIKAGPTTADVCAVPDGRIFH